MNEDYLVLLLVPLKTNSPRTFQRSFLHLRVPKEADQLSPSDVAPGPSPHAGNEEVLIS